MITPRFSRDFVVPPGTATERREAIEREQQQRAAERQELIAAQSSPLHNSRHRIGVWEHLHAMRLPRVADHRLVRVIAEQTGLTVEQVQQEQQRRAMAAAPARAG